jgi:predicted transposase YdaD
MGQIDVSLKHVIAEHPQDWAQFFGVQSGVWVQAIDTDVSIITSVTDKVLYVMGDAPFILHLEPQGYYDEALDPRMYAYNGLLYRRHRAFVHTVVVLLAETAWGPANTGGVQAWSPVGRCWVDFRYELIKVWELPVDRLLTAGVGLLPLAPVADVEPEALPQVIDRMAQRFDREVPRAEAAELWTATYVLVGLKYDRMFARTLLRRVREIMRESVTYQAIIEEGHGEAKRDSLIKLGTKRFGPPPAEVRARISSVMDLDVLDAMLLRVLDATSWDDWLAGVEMAAD